MTRNATAMTMSIIKSKNCSISGKELRDRVENLKSIKQTDIHSLGLCVFPDIQSSHFTPRIPCPQPS